MAVRKLLYASVIILTLVAARPGSEAPIRQGSSSPQAGSPLCLCSFVAPTYPPVARINNIQGVVRLRLSFDSNGNLEHSQVLEGGHVLLADSPAEAVKGWRACPSPETQENRQVERHLPIRSPGDANAVLGGHESLLPTPGHGSCRDGSAVWSPSGLEIIWAGG